MNQSLGILGGLGPLASAEFLKTIYEFNITDLEQDSPTCILYSNPTFPDRTEAILQGENDLLVSLLIDSLEKLFLVGVSKVAIACITMHYFLPKVPKPLREKVISLIDLIIQEILDTPRNHLLLCTNGSRQAGIFQKHARWNLVEEYILLPDDDDQNKLHGYIYQIKKNCDRSSIANYIDYLDTLTYKYQVDSFIAGCTEFHIVNKHLMKSEYKGKSYQIVDPLITIAKNLNKLME